MTKKNTCNLAGVRLKQKFNRKVKDTQKVYWFICPYDTMKIGDWVVVGVRPKTKSKISGYEHFEVGRVDEIKYNMTLSEIYRHKPRPYSCVYGRLNVKNFDDNVTSILNIRTRILKYFSDRENAEKRKA